MDDSKLDYISDFIHEFRGEALLTNKEIDIRIATDLMHRAENQLKEI